MGHVAVGHRWDWVAMDLLDLSVTSAKGNRYVLVMVMSLVSWAVGIQKHPDSPILLIHCQDVKKVPQPSGVMSWIKTPQPVGAPQIPVLGASTVAHTSQGSPSGRAGCLGGCGFRGLYAIHIGIIGELSDYDGG